MTTAVTDTTTAAIESAIDVTYRRFCRLRLLTLTLSASSALHSRISGRRRDPDASVDAALYALAREATQVRGQAATLALLLPDGPDRQRWTRKLTVGLQSANLSVADYLSVPRPTSWNADDAEQLQEALHTHLRAVAHVEELPEGGADPVLPDDLRAPDLSAVEPLRAELSRSKQQAATADTAVRCGLATVALLSYAKQQPTQLLASENPTSATVTNAIYWLTSEVQAALVGAQQRLYDQTGARARTAAAPAAAAHTAALIGYELRRAAFHLPLEAADRDALVAQLLALPDVAQLLTV